MAITQEQFLGLVDKVGTLAGEQKVLAERLGNTNDKLGELIQHLEMQGRQRMTDRKWAIGTFIAASAAVATIWAIVIRYML